MVVDKPFTVDEFAAWARGKNSEKLYDYVSNYECPVALFLKETNRANTPVVTPNPFEKNGEWYDEAVPVKRGKRPVMHPIPRKALEAARALPPWSTFGQLVERLG